MLKLLALFCLLVILQHSESLAEFSEQDDYYSISAEQDSKLKNSTDDLSEVKFLLWTRLNEDDYFNLEVFDNSSVEESPLDFSLPTFVIFHGYNDHGTTGYIIDTKNALLQKMECNVISVDHETLVTPPGYPKSVQNSYRVAALSAEYIDWLKVYHQLDLKMVHIIGHSLGGQTAGMCGQYLKEGTVARVTGLDPAGPEYYEKNDTMTISRKSGDFVDIIHTNGGFIVNGCAGLLRSVGHVDFYPNGGSHQPDCVHSNATGGDLMDAIENCSHHRSVLYWIESILAESPEDNTFYSWPCEDYQTFDQGGCTSCQDGCQELGLPANPNLPGDYYLHVSASSPYALGQENTDS